MTYKIVFNSIMIKIDFLYSTGLGYNIIFNSKYLAHYLKQKIANTIHKTMSK